MQLQDRLALITLVPCFSTETGLQLTNNYFLDNNLSSCPAIDLSELFSCGGSTCTIAIRIMSGVDTEDRPDRRIIECWLTQENARMLSQGGFRWTLSRPFVTRSGQVTNTVWRSLPIAPRNTVTWSTTYGFNWTLTSPDDNNGGVRVNGPWQACARGESYDIDSYGFWKPSSAPGRPGYMSVGINRFSDPDSNGGIYIVIGQRDDDTSDWEPVSSSLLEKI